MWVWQDDKPITLGFGIIPSSNTYEVDNLCRPHIGSWWFICLFLCLLTWNIKNQDQSSPYISRYTSSNTYEVDNLCWPHIGSWWFICLFLCLLTWNIKNQDQSSPYISRYIKAFWELTIFSSTLMLCRSYLSLINIVYMRGYLSLINVTRRK
jgi:hypothetical protein